MFDKQTRALFMTELLGTGILALVIFTLSMGTPYPFFTGVAAGLAFASIIIFAGKNLSVHLNPVLTLSLWAAKKVNTIPALIMVLGQLIGGVGAWQLLEYLLNGPIASTSLLEFDVRDLVSEAVGAFVFVLIFSSAVWKKYDLGKTAFVAGGALMSGILAASIVSGGYINPAVAAGIQRWSTAYVLGPLIGGLVGVGAYYLMFAPLDVPASNVAKIKKVATKVVQKAKKTSPKKKK
jgi:glycerol uptake facilitator-like aquaporin